jgi:hypothetical protein
MACTCGHFQVVWFANLNATFSFTTCPQYFFGYFGLQACFDLSIFSLSKESLSIFAQITWKGDFSIDYYNFYRMEIGALCLIHGVHTIFV